MGEGVGGGEYPLLVPPLLNPLPRRGEEVFRGIIFGQFLIEMPFIGVS